MKGLQLGMKKSTYWGYSLNAYLKLSLKIGIFFGLILSFLPSKEMPLTSIEFWIYSSILFLMIFLVFNFILFIRQRMIKNNKILEILKMFGIEEESSQEN
ncbi:MAG: hypothetical protein FWG67_04540 [Defluviitaleaceae bacterium]|nr:hypothetical protein [Defluviitaleaceae bacterium]